MFINRIYRHARENPDKLAVVNSGQEITYRQFANAIEAVRNYLMRARLPSDGVIVNITSNLYHDWVLLLALRSLGHTTVSGTSWKAIEGLDLKSIAGLVCLSDQTETIDAFGSARSDCVIVQVPRDMVVGNRNSPPPPPIADGPFGDQIVYTSGTTGTHKKLLFRGPQAERAIEDSPYGLTGKYLTKDDLYFGYSFGPWTAAGYKAPLRCWHRGATIIFDQRPEWAEHFYDYPVTMTFFVPGLLDEVSRSIASRPADYPPLKAQVGGGFLNADMASKLIRQLGCKILAAYGGTEFRTALTNFVCKKEDVIWLTPTFEPGIEIVDEDDRRLPRGEEGILRIELAPTDPTEYLDDPETTAKHYRDGFFYPGDMAVQREDGRIRILGRVDDVLNVGGQKIAIEPFEQRVKNVLQVDSLCAFMQQDDEGKEMLLVVIEGSELPDRARLQALARQAKDVPQIRFALINKFPRGENGMMKINRQKVLNQVSETFSERKSAAE